MTSLASNFVHLHCHSEYSLLDGFCPVDKLLERAKELGMSSLAVTDHGNLYAAVTFSRQARKYGIKPIIGCEVYVAPGSRFDKTPAAQTRFYHLVLLCEDQTGYHNLVRLVTAAHLEGFYYKPRIDKELLAEHNAGLIALSSCLAGEIPALLLANDYEGAKAVARSYQEIFGPDRFYLELQDQGLPEQRQVNAGLLQLSQELGLPVVATNDVHYLTQADAVAHDCILCVGTGTKLADRDRMRFESDQFYLKSGAEMAELFREVPEAILNTQRIAERCRFELALGGMYLPVFDLPAGYSDAAAYLRFLCEEALPEKYGANPSPEVKNRLEHELQVISSLGYSDYFLIVWDFIRYAKSQGIPVGPGRGSAAGSLVAYLLGITGIDPLEYGLLFERFLNPERVTMPDIDIDFDYERRGEVIEYVRQKYGDDRVAQIITFGTLQARAAIRDIGRVLDLPINKVDQLAKLVPNELGITIADALAKEPRLAALYQDDAEARQLLDLAKAVEGLPRHASTHAAGVVIGAGPLAELVPLQLGTDGGVVTQYDMGSLEAVGLLKMDFLGLRTLTVIDSACKLVKELTGQTIDLAKLPLDDPEVYRMLSAGQAQGVFQMESRLFHRLLLQVRPTCFKDLIALVSLGRPGPVNMVPDFAARKHGEQPVEYLHPKLEAILEETYGIMVYQEQVMRIASELAGFTLGEADLLRRAMGKKKIEELLAMKQRFVEGAAANGVELATAQKIFEAMEYFANYGFNKSHAAAYALVAYWTAYLRRYYPAAFFAAMLTSVRNNTDKLRSYVFTIRHELGIEVLPPRINESQLDFTVQDSGIRFGLGAIKNVGDAAARAIIEEREQNGPYRSMLDLCTRLPGRVLNRAALESLIKAGACDEFGESRLQLLADVELVLAQASRGQIATGQVSLFDELPPAGGAQTAGSAAQHVDLEQILAYEKESLGLYLSGHPLDKYREKLQEFVSGDLAEPEALADNAEIIVAGVVSELNLRRTRKGQLMARLQLEDERGSINVIVFPSIYQKRAEYLNQGSLVVLHGRVEQQEEGIILVASEVIPITPGHLIVCTEAELPSLEPNQVQKPALLKILGERRNIILIVPS
ncbi:MAG: DNA polymerase III subunit alpha [Firmicutes bacterium]|nr:DNA polymerase III subunit alpha [Bacillota bacterium]